MDSLISICRWVSRALSFFLTFAIGLPGLLVSAVVSIVLAVQGVRSDFAGFTYDIVQFFNTASNAVSAFMARISTFEYYPIFHNILALDVLGTLLVTLVVTFCALIVFIAFGLFFQALVILLPFSGFKLITKLISLISAGFLKP